MPRFEGSLWPVVSPVALFESGAIPAPPPPRTRFRAAAVKYRECDFVGIEWYLGQRGGRKTKVTAQFEDRPQIRDVGTLEWAGLVVGLSDAETRQDSYADVLHQCPAFRLGGALVMRPWLTRTRFYDPPE